MNKYFQILFFFAMAILTISCGNKSSSEASTSTGIDQSKLKGQSGVVDDQSQPNILQIAISSADHSILL